MQTRWFLLALILGVALFTQCKCESSPEQHKEVRPIDSGDFADVSQDITSVPDKAILKEKSQEETTQPDPSIFPESPETHPEPKSSDNQPKEQDDKTETTKQDGTSIPPATSISSHVRFPELGTIPWPLDCSNWPEKVPVKGYFASVFGYRIQGGKTDFHRGIDLRCNRSGNTCCTKGGKTRCDTKSCKSDEKESLAPIKAILSGVVRKVESGSNNNLIVRTTLPNGKFVQFGNKKCQTIDTWYQHVHKPTLNPTTGQKWKPGDSVQSGQHIAYQSNSGANTHHLHLSLRLCGYSRADGEKPPKNPDPEVNPLQLLRPDDKKGPSISASTAHIQGADVLVTTEIHVNGGQTTDFLHAGDFDNLWISLHDENTNKTHIRKMGYNNRDSIDIPGDNFDTSQLLNGFFLAGIFEPKTPKTDSGIRVRLLFRGLSIKPHPKSYVVITASDFSGNTSHKRIGIGP